MLIIIGVIYILKMISTLKGLKDAVAKGSTKFDVYSKLVFDKWTKIGTINLKDASTLVVDNLHIESANIDVPFVINAYFEIESLKTGVFRQDHRDLTTIENYHKIFGSDPYNFPRVPKTVRFLVDSNNDTSSFQLHYGITKGESREYVSTTPGSIVFKPVSTKGGGGKKSKRTRTGRRKRASKKSRKSHRNRK